MKCEHHDDLKDYFKSITDNVDIKFDAQSKRIEDVERRQEKAFEIIDGIRSDASDNYAEQKQTESYVKSLYRAVDQLTSTVQGMVLKMDQYIEEVAVVKSDTDKNSEFAAQGKKIVFEIIKYLVLFILGFAIANQA